MQVSRRAQDLQASPIRKLTPYALAAKAKGVKVYHLNIGQPDIESPEIFLQKIREFDQKVVAYEKSDGYEPLKQMFVDYFAKKGLGIEKEDLLVTSGGSEALGMIFFILFEAGDECITLEPTYTNYITFADFVGVKLVPVTTYLEDNFGIPGIEAIKQAVTDKTKGIIITNPSNPTGAVYSAKQLQELVDFCVEKNLFIIADETYREFVYGEAKVVSLLSFKKAEQLVVSAESLSKRYSLCGARIGALVSKNKQVIESGLKISQAKLAVAAIEQYAASFLGQVPNSFLEKIKQEYQERRDVLLASLNRIEGVKTCVPEGAFYLIAELPVEDAEDFCKFMLNDFEDGKETVMMAPAEGFYITPGMGKNQVRIAYVLKSEDLKRAGELIGLGLEQYRHGKIGS